MGNEMLWAAVHAERTALARDLDSLSLNPPMGLWLSA